MTTIRDVMTRKPTAVRVNTSVESALAAMVELDVRHLPVVNEDHELVGMLSDRDFRGLPHVGREAREMAGDTAPRPGAAVASIMSGDTVSVGADDDVREAVDLMIEHRIGAVPVTNPQGHLVGIVSYIDILRVLGNRL